MNGHLQQHLRPKLKERWYSQQTSGMRIQDPQHVNHPYQRLAQCRLVMIPQRPQRWCKVETKLPENVAPKSRLY